MTESTAEPGGNDLRNFSFLMGLLLPGLFGLAVPFLAGHASPLWPWIIGGVFIVTGVAAPAAVRPVYRAWMRFGLVMSRIMNPLILGLIFFVIFFPVACIMRLINRDPLHRRFEPDAGSYRVSRGMIKKESMENPF